MFRVLFHECLRFQIEKYLGFCERFLGIISVFSVCVLLSGERRERERERERETTKKRETPLGIKEL